MSKLILDRPQRRAAPAQRRSRVLLGAALMALAAATTCAGVPAAAQGSWNPFAEPAPPTPGSRRQPARAPAEPARPPVAPTLPADMQPGAFAPRETVERSDLPALPADGPGAAAPGGEADPTAVAALAKLTAELAVPMRSPALTRLLVKALGAHGFAEASQPEAIGARSIALYRAGRVAEADAVANGGAHAAHSERERGPASVALTALRARLALAVGDRERACGQAQALAQTGTGLPPSIAAEGIVIQGYCGAAAGNPSAAGLAAGLGRDQGSVPPASLAALEAIAAGETPAFDPTATRIGVIDWRLIEVAGGLDGVVLPLERLEPAALVAIAMAQRAPPRLRIGAAEAAARLNAVDAPTLAEIYRGVQATTGDLTQAQTPGARAEGWSRRALLLKAAEAERTPFKRTRLIRAALDDARRNGLYMAMAGALSRAVEEIRPVAEVGWFAETAVEVMLIAGRLDDARRWTQLGADAAVTGDRASPSLSHWLGLIDIADPANRGGRGTSLASVEDIALRGRYTPEALHRLATVLDALDFHVPMRLWEAASRAPQPTTGHLPSTGVLTALQDAARRRDLLRTVALVFHALGPDGPEGAHMIALGDTIRALRRAGLEPDARAVATEALLALWPRSSSS